MSNDQKKSRRRPKYPELAINRLYAIGVKLRDGDSLEQSENAFIADAFLNICNGVKVEKALGLTSRKIKITWKVRMKIWNEIEKLGKDPRFAFLSGENSNITMICEDLVPREDIRKLLNVKDGEELKVSRIRGIYYETKEYMEILEEIHYDDPGHIERLRNI